MNHTGQYQADEGQLERASALLKQIVTGKYPVATDSWLNTDHEARYALSDGYVSHFALTTQRRTLNAIAAYAQGGQRRGYVRGCVWWVEGGVVCVQKAELYISLAVTQMVQIGEGGKILDVHEHVWIGED